MDSAHRIKFEYEVETRGLRHYRDSHGLEATLGLDEDTRTEEQIIEDKRAVGLSVIEVSAGSWYNMVSAGKLSAILDALEEPDKTTAEE
jgi:hypothetical protein